MTSYTALNALTDGILVIERDYNIVFANEAIGHMYNLPPASIIGRKCYEFSHNRTLPCDEECLHDAPCSYKEVFKNGTPIKHTHHHVLPDGTRKIFEITTSSIENNGNTTERIVQVIKDVTILEKITKGARETSIELERIFNSVPLSIVYLDSNLRVLRMNHLMETLTGLKNSQVRGKHCYDLWGQYAEAKNRHGSEKFCDQCRAIHALKDGKKYVFERQVAEKIIEVHTVPVKYDGDTINGVLEIGRDITLFRQAQEKQRDSEERYKRVVDNVGLGIAIISPQMRIQALNKQMAAWFPEIDITQDLKPLCYCSFNNPPRDKVCTYCPVVKALKDGKVHEALTETPQGKATRNYRIVASPLKNKKGKVVSVIEVVEDLTEKHLMNKALLESRSRYRNLFESGPVPLVVADASIIKERLDDLYLKMNGDLLAHLSTNPKIANSIRDLLKITDVNNAVLHLFQLPSKEELFKNIEKLLELIHICEFPEGLIAMAKGKASFSHEINITTFLGEQRIIILNWIVEPGYEKSYKRVLFSLIDITERKKAEESLRKLSIYLEKTEQSERKRLSRDLHDNVGQYLTALGINLQILKNAAVTKNVPDINARFDNSIELVAEATEEIRSIMADLRPPVLDDYGLLSSLQWLAKKKETLVGLSVQVFGEEPSPRLNSHMETALYHIAQEALTNVLKHAGVSMAEIHLQVKEHTFCLTVRDNGCGFDVERMKHLWVNEKWGILGMQERAEALGAKFLLQSQPGSGTKITVEIPR